MVAAGHVREILGLLQRRTCRDSQSFCSAKHVGSMYTCSAPCDLQQVKTYNVSTYPALATCNNSLRDLLTTGVFFRQRLQQVDEPHMLPCGVCSYCECDLVWDDMVGHGERNVWQTVQQCEVHFATCNV